MIEIEIGHFFTAFMGFAIVAIFALNAWFEHKDAQKIYTQDEQASLFHCHRCSKIYSGFPKKGQAHCPKCQFLNQELKF